MSLTRANIESSLIRSVGPKLILVGLNGQTQDGTNPDLNDPIRRAVASMGAVTASYTVADGDLAGFVGFAVEKLIDYARLEALKIVLGRTTLWDQKISLGEQKLSTFVDGLREEIRQIEERLSKPYGPTLPAASIGSLSPHGPLMPNDPFAPYRSRTGWHRWPYPY